MLLKREEHKQGVSARAEGESRVLRGVECDQGSGGEEPMYRDSLKENVSAQTQFIQEKKKTWAG